MPEKQIKLSEEAVAALELICHYEELVYVRDAEAFLKWMKEHKQFIRCDFDWPLFCSALSELEEAGMIVLTRQGTDKVNHEYIKHYALTEDGKEFCAERCVK
jgi:hypothetical protein